MTSILAYHFLSSDFTAGEGGEPPWEIGETRTVAEPSRIILCGYGYHSSPTLRDALEYAPGPLACLVKISEPVKKNDDKQVSASRTLLKAVNIERELRLFACDCAEHVLHLYETRHPNDPRSREAIETARRFANGKARKQELRAAWDAARDAGAAWRSGLFWDAAQAAGAAARDAAWAAARAAAWNAAWDAAWTAAWAAARDAAWEARDAAYAAARDAAREAEVAWQRQHWDEMFGGIFDER